MKKSQLKQLIKEEFPSINLTDPVAPEESEESNYIEDDPEALEMLDDYEQKYKDITAQADQIVQEWSQLQEIKAVRGGAQNYLRYKKVKTEELAREMKQAVINLVEDFTTLKEGSYMYRLVKKYPTLTKQEILDTCLDSIGYDLTHYMDDQEAVDNIVTLIVKELDELIRGQ